MNENASGGSLIEHVLVMILMAVYFGLTAFVVVFTPIRLFQGAAWLIRRIRGQATPERQAGILHKIRAGFADSNSMWPRYYEQYLPMSGGTVAPWRLYFDLLRRILLGNLRGLAAGAKRGQKDEAAYRNAALAGKDGRLLTRVVEAIATRYHRRGERLWRDEFRGWPKLWRIGGTPERPVIRLKARYPSPASVKQAWFYAFFPAVVAGFLLTDFLAVTVQPWESWWQHNWLFALIGFGSFMLAYRLLKKLFQRIIPGDALVMTFDGGGIEWKGDEQRQKWFGFGIAKARKMPGQEWSVERVMPHRKAAEEVRLNEALVRKQEQRRQKLKPKPMYYQQCSEVVIYIGPGLAHTVGVAELAFDEQGDRARRLIAAIIAAEEAASGKSAGMVAVDTPRTEDSEPPRRRGLFG